MAFIENPAERATMQRHMVKCQKCKRWLKHAPPKSGYLDGMCSYGKGQIVKVVREVSQRNVSHS